MVWNPANPAAGIQARYIDDAVRENNTAVDAVFGDLLDAGVAVTATAAELNILDGVTSSAAELNILDGVTSSAAELNILDGVTSSAAELNILDGVTASTAELNILDGVTASTAELNIMDGVTATAAEINAAADGIGSTIPRQVIIEIGDWNMVANGSKNVVHGMTLSKIIGVNVMIRNDADTARTPLLRGNSSTGAVSGMIGDIDATLIALFRLSGGSFDNTNHDSTSYNRGWVIIDYVD